MGSFYLGLRLIGAFADLKGKCFNIFGGGLLGLEFEIVVEARFRIEASLIG